MLEFGIFCVCDHVGRAALLCVAAHFLIMICQTDNLLVDPSLAVLYNCKCKHNLEESTDICHLVVEIGFKLAA